MTIRICDSSSHFAAIGDAIIAVAEDQTIHVVQCFRGSHHTDTQNIIQENDLDYVPGLYFAKRIYEYDPNQQNIVKWCIVRAIIQIEVRGR